MPRKISWSRRHPTAAWIAVALLVSLIWLGVRDGGVPVDPRLSMAVLAVALVTGALAIGSYLRRRHRRLT